MLKERSASAAKVVGNGTATAMSWRTVYKALVEDPLSELEVLSLSSPSPSPSMFVFPITPGGQNGQSGSQNKMPR